MKIDINNYEAFFLDFAEGRLDDASTLEMLAFLRKHPELKAELESFGDLRLVPDEIVFGDKNNLKKFEFSSISVNRTNFDDFCVAYYEKLLDPVDERRLLAFLDQHPEKRRDFQWYGKTFLKADQSIIFEAKPFLKRNPGKVRSIVLRLTAVAAGVVLLISIFYKSPQERPSELRPAITSIKEKHESSDDKPIIISINTGNKNESSPNKSLTDVVAYIPEEVPQPEEIFSLLEAIPSAKLQLLNQQENNDPIYLTETVTPNFAEDDEFEFLNYAEKMLQEKILNTETVKPKRKFSLWDFADITLKGYNSIAEKDIVLHRKTDENGKLTVIAIETENKKYGFETRN